VCGESLDPKLATAGDTTHPNCGPEPANIAEDLARDATGEDSQDACTACGKPLDPFDAALGGS
jgi:hypothetical protein